MPREFSAAVIRVDTYRPGTCFHATAPECGAAAAVVAGPRRRAPGYPTALANLRIVDGRSTATDGFAPCQLATEFVGHDVELAGDPGAHGVE